jgi:hypothetical protein
VPTLKEFLASQADRLRAEESKAAQRRDEWLASLDRLYTQINSWIREADTASVLIIRDGFLPKRELGIGEYDARCLWIEIGSRQVRIEPVARTVAGPTSLTGVIHVPRAYGRVDMTNGLSKFMLFRVEKEPEDRWNIIEQDSYHMRPFNQTSFEEALQSLLE